MHVADVFGRGGAGGEELARGLLALLARERSAFAPLYALDDPIKVKLDTIARRIYGADGVEYPKRVERQIAQAESLGYGRLPICVAKTAALAVRRPDPAEPARAASRSRSTRSASRRAPASWWPSPVTSPRCPASRAEPNAERVDVDAGRRHHGALRRPALCYTSRRSPAELATRTYDPSRQSHEALRTGHGHPRCVLHRGEGPHRRLSRPQRGGQVHHDEDPLRASCPPPAAPRRWPASTCSRSRWRCGGGSAISRRTRRSIPISRSRSYLDFVAEIKGVGADRAARPGGRRDGAVLHRGHAEPADRQALEGLPAAGRAGPGPPGRSGGADPRRAHHRARPAADRGDPRR